MRLSGTREEIAQAVVLGLQPPADDLHRWADRAHAKGLGGDTLTSYSAGSVPDLAALKSAARAAIVIPAVFALADKVIKQPQTSILAAFGSFAMLVLVEFAGPPRKRLAAYAGLGCVGAAFITLGTL